MKIWKRTGAILSLLAGPGNQTSPYRLPRSWSDSRALGRSQGFTPDRQTSYALAGGRILGNKAIMAVLKTPSFTWTFSEPCTIPYACQASWSNILAFFPEPIWTIRALGLSLGFSEEYDNAKGTLTISVNDARRKVLFEVASDQVILFWPFNCAVCAHLSLVTWFPPLF